MGHCNLFSKYSIDKKYRARHRSKVIVFLRKYVFRKKATAFWTDLSRNVSHILIHRLYEGNSTFPLHEAEKFKRAHIDLVAVQRFRKSFRYEGHFVVEKIFTPGNFCISRAC